MAKKKVFKRFALKVIVTDRLVEVIEGWWPFQRRWVVPFRTLNEVTWNTITNTIRLEAGVGRPITIGFFFRSKAKACYEAILAGGN